MLLQRRAKTGGPGAGKPTAPVAVRKAVVPKKAPEQVIVMSSEERTALAAAKAR